VSGNTDSFFDWEPFPGALKHAIVEGYLEDAFPILLRNPGKDVIYADLFAGAGEYESGAPGSPKIAARLAGRRHASSQTPRIYCFNVEREKQTYDKLVASLREFPAEVVMSRPGDWHDHYQELAGLMQGKSSIVFLDPFRLDVELDALEDFVRPIGQESRELILTLHMHGIYRNIQAAAKEERRRHEAELQGRSPALMPRDYYRKLNAVLGRQWWHELLVDGELPSANFGKLAEGYCAQLRSMGSPSARGRKAVAVPIPHRLGGAISYYLIFVTRSPTAVTRFSDAADAAVTAGWRRPDADLLQRRTRAGQQMQLLPDLAPEFELTFEEQRSRELLPLLAEEVTAFFARRPWPVEFRWLHAELAERFCGRFSERHIREIVVAQRAAGVLGTSTPAVSRHTVVGPAASVSSSPLAS
jgi:three-Cys-motif partner protein